MDRFPTMSSTLDFVEKLVSEESVFCLPGEVSYIEFFYINGKIKIDFGFNVQIIS